MSERSLCSLTPGEEGRILRVDGAVDIRVRLQEMGLIRGAPVRFIRAAPLGDPIEIRVRGHSLTLRRGDAAGVILDALI